MGALNYSDVLEGLSHVADSVIQQEAYLAKVDAQTGDGDHGPSMSRGFGEVKARLQALVGTGSGEPPPTEAIGSLLRSCGMGIVSRTGGVTGPLFGTIFIRAGEAAAGKNELGVSDLAAIFEAGLQGVKQRGGAREGDKTMVDALAPAVRALTEAAAEGEPVGRAMARAARAASCGALATKEMYPRQGKARYLGDRALGFQDAGATSVAIIFEALAEVWSDK